MAGKLTKVASFLGGNGVVLRSAGASLHQRAGMGLFVGNHIVPDKPLIRTVSLRGTMEPRFPSLALIALPMPLESMKHWLGCVEDCVVLRQLDWLLFGMIRPLRIPLYGTGFEMKELARELINEQSLLVFGRGYTMKRI